MMPGLASESAWRPKDSRKCFEDSGRSYLALYGGDGSMVPHQPPRRYRLHLRLL
jgi:hypothetical protein